ncbi:MAG: hypothetical protein EZS28_047205 [Streblomastix strix]|uniref:Uncharacterized protein n=1 Tax=Streblomastix strix TaxID=222440 RepID=A0A5J4TG80_9EUKA|nr:MAG: hypothetical protein EZS28_047205 [Streblomastix strix]
MEEQGTVEVVSDEGAGEVDLTAVEVEVDCTVDGFALDGRERGYIVGKTSSGFYKIWISGSFNSVYSNSSNG